jgi:hypothetical protein
MAEKPSAEAETVKVVVRCRPMSTREVADGRKSVMDADLTRGQIIVRNPDTNAVGAGDAKTFNFDAVYDADSSQRAIYEETAYPLVESVLTGYNGTIFAYGQTGCGKTHTMQGKAEPPELRGIIPNSFDHIFDHIKVASAAKRTEFLVRCSYLEIYNEEIRDLLSSDHLAKLELHEDPDRGVYAKDLTQVVVDSTRSIDKVMTDGNKYRTTGATLMNETSSRSHSIFTIIIEQSTLGEDGKDHIVRGKLNLVDLAGSERLSKTGATGVRMKEGIKVNLSLTALGNVISALVDLATTGKAHHVPYRDSKLTRLLQDSLGGNTKTVMVAAVGPADYNYDETLSTLRYANRAKNIKNKPSINEDPKDALLRQYKDEIERLRTLLVEHLTAAGLDPASMKAILANVGGGAGAAAQMKALPAAAAALGKAAGAIGGKLPVKPFEGPGKALGSSDATAVPGGSTESTPVLSAAAVAPVGAASAGGTVSVPVAIAASGSASTPTLPSVTSASSGGAVSADATALPPLASSSSEGGLPDKPVIDVASPGIDSITGTAIVEEITVVPNTGRGGASYGGGGMDSIAASKQLSDALESAVPRSFTLANGLTIEAAEAIDAARRDADRERKERETLAQKLLALQQMVVGSAARPAGSSTPKSASSSPARNNNPSSSLLGAPSAYSLLPAFVSPAASRSLDRDTMLASPLSPNWDDDPELTQAIARDDLRREQARARQQSKRAAQAAVGASAGSGAEEDAADDTAEASLFGDAPRTRRPQSGSGTTAPGAGVTPAEGSAGGMNQAEKEYIGRKMKARYAGRIATLTSALAEQAEEWSQQREAMAATVREQAKESKLLESLVALFLAPAEMNRVWERASWNEEEEEWTVPLVKPRPGFKVRESVAAHARTPLAVSQPGAYSGPRGRASAGQGSAGSIGDMEDEEEEGGAMVSDTELDYGGGQPVYNGATPKVVGTSGGLLPPAGGAGRSRGNKPPLESPRNGGGLPGLTPSPGGRQVQGYGSGSSMLLLEESGLPAVAGVGSARKPLAPSSTQPSALSLPAIGLGGRALPSFSLNLPSNLQLPGLKGMIEQDFFLLNLGAQGGGGGSFGGGSSVPSMPPLALAGAAPPAPTTSRAPGFGSGGGGLPDLFAKVLPPNNGGGSYSGAPMGGGLPPAVGAVAKMPPAKAAVRGR